MSVKGDRKFAKILEREFFHMRCIQTHSRTYKKLIFRCQAAGEPTPSWELFRWISARDVLELSTKTPKNFLEALKNCTSNRCEAKRPGSNAPCGGRSQPSKGRHDFRARSLLSWPKRYNYNRSFFNIFSTEIINFFRYRKPEILSSYYTNQLTNHKTSSSITLHSPV